MSLKSKLINFQFRLMLMCILGDSSICLLPPNGDIIEFWDLDFGSPISACFLFLLYFLLLLLLPMIQFCSYSASPLTRTFLLPQFPLQLFSPILFKSMSIDGDGHLMSPCRLQFRKECSEGTAWVVLLALKCCWHQGWGTLSKGLLSDQVHFAVSLHHTLAAKLGLLCFPSFEEVL